MNDLNNKIKLVGMKGADISTLEKPIIGTRALATCVGVLLYNEDKKIAIVAHLSTEWRETMENVLELVATYELNSAPIKYKIIPGYYHNNYNVAEDIKKIFDSMIPIFIPFNQRELDNDIEIDEETTSKRFAFDSQSGKFVTKFIDFDKVVVDNKNKTI